ncbi:hypothetical protein [Streptomyces sp. NPDC002386]
MTWQSRCWSGTSAGQAAQLDDDAREGEEVFGLAFVSAMEAAAAGQHTCVRKAEERITGIAADGTLRRSVFALGDLAAHHLAVLNFYLAIPDTPERLTGLTWLAKRAPKLTA